MNKVGQERISEGFRLAKSVKGLFREALEQRALPPRASFVR
jgi:hypothetical protein